MEDGQLDDAAARVGAAWRQLRRGASTLELRQMLYGGSATTLDVAQGDALVVLIEHGPIRMSDLAAQLRVDASTATRTVARLISAGLAVRVPDRADGRVVAIKATSLGRRRQAAMVESAKAALDEILSAFDPAERLELADLMERLVASLDAFVATRRRPAPRLAASTPDAIPIA